MDILKPQTTLDTSHREDQQTKTQKHTYIYKDEQHRLLPNTRVRSENAGVFIISVAICFGSTGLLTGLLVIPDL